ncbi:MAG: hypothetical protein LBU81_01455 [Methanosarcinales archaeon]|jgi:hypothetical protein|nr:hypothetical protein [Methanosarcinales archaeon]
MAVFFVFSIYGIYGMILERDNPPLPFALVLLIFSILFVIGYEFFNSRFVRSTMALGIAFLASLCLTVLIMALVKFVRMSLAGTVTDIGPETFVIALAVGLVGSVILLKYFENF